MIRDPYVHGRDQRVELDPRLQVGERLLGDRRRIAGEQGPHGLPRGGVGHLFVESAVSDDDDALARQVAEKSRNGRRAN